MKTYKYLPGGNPTLLIENLDDSILPEQYPTIAQAELSPDIEQVGFIERGKNAEFRLAMMGGEFCINALRSLALWVNQRNGERKVVLESSGIDNLIVCEVEGDQVSIQIPSEGIRKKAIDDDLTLVYLEGIAHFIQKDFQWKDEASMREEFLKKILPLIKQEVNDYPAVGYIGVSALGEVYPLVYVKSTESLIYETACGSGTLAAYIAQTGALKEFTQPSGYGFSVNNEANGYVLKSRVIGLEIFAEKTNVRP